MTSQNLAILGEKLVCQKTGKSRATIWREIRNGCFPAPIKLGKRAVGWLEAEVDDWIASRIRDRDAGKNRSLKIDSCSLTEER